MRLVPHFRRPQDASSLVRVFLFAVLAATTPALFAQGALTPPGGPAPSMKSLGELDASLTALAAKAEARIAIDTLPGDADALRIISAPGSYYLRGNLVSASNTTSAIRVTTDGVAIDLNGFSLIGTGATSTVSAIETGAGTRRRLVIRNGGVTGWYDGVEGGVDVLVEDLAIDTCRRYGAELSDDSIVRRLQVRGCGYSGIRGGLVEACRVRSIGGFGSHAIGISGTIVRDCEVRVIAASPGSNAYGIIADSVIGCRVFSVSGDSYVYGINAYTGFTGTVVHCSVESVSTSGNSYAIGISGAHISDSIARDIGGAGAINYGISGDTVENCSVDSIYNNSAGSVAYGIFAPIVRGSRVTDLSGVADAAVGILGSLVSDCWVSAVQSSAGTGTGIRLNSSGIARGNSIVAVRNYGIQSGTACVIENNTIRSIGTDAGVTTGAGILLTMANTRVVNNCVIGATGCDYGIRISSGTLNFVAGNRCSGTFSGAATGALVDTPEFNLVTGNRWGTILGGSGEVTTSNPNANFSD